MKRLAGLRFVAAALVAALALSGCVPGQSDGQGAPDITDEDAATVLALRSEPFDESKVAIVTAALEDAGVAIAQTWDPDAEEVVRITPWQVQNMAAEAANDGGVTGAELAALSPTRRPTSTHGTCRLTAPLAPGRS